MLDIRGVNVAFNGVRAVRDVSLTVSRGEFVSLLGPSGCGKTTLLRSVAGYVFPDSGDIFLDGRNVTNLTPQQRRIGMVFQNYALFPHMTVAENIAFGLRQQKRPELEIRQRVAAMLATVRLEGYEQRRPNQLSGGQQQRVALARALAFEPRLLLLDEPLGALDLRLREQMQEEIRRVQQDAKVTALFVTHDQGEALAMSDRIAVMNVGRFEQVENPRDLYAKPKTAFVANFVGKSNLLSGVLDRMNDTESLVRLDGLTATVSTQQSHSGATAGARGQIAIRPENVRLRRKGEPSFFEATITSVQFLGTHQLIGLHLDGEQRIHAHATEPWEIGERAGVHWAASNARFLTS